MRRGKRGTLVSSSQLRVQNEYVLRGMPGCDQGTLFMRQPKHEEYKREDFHNSLCLELSARVEHHLNLDSMYRGELRGGHCF